VHDEFEGPVGDGQEGREVPDEPGEDPKSTT
jgi:hypothetical protein